MNWDAVGAIAELLGAIGVISSLLYLAVQIRQNTRASRSATRTAWLNAVQVTNQLNISTPENADVWHRGAILGEILEGKDFTLFSTQISAAINAFETLFLEYHNGNIDEEFWNSKARTMSAIITTPSGSRVWQIWESTSIGDPRFSDYVNSNILTGHATGTNLVDAFAELRHDKS